MNCLGLNFLRSERPENYNQAGAFREPLFDRGIHFVHRLKANTVYSFFENKPEELYSPTPSPVSALYFH